MNSWHGGVVVTVLAVGFVGLRLLSIHLQRPRDLEAHTTAYGSIRNFYGPVQLNRDGSQFIFAATADDRGRAIFLADARTGKKTPIIEDTHGVGIWNDDFNIQAGPWSPDDNAFVATIDNELIVSAPATNKILARFPTGPNVTASDVVWLSPTQLAWHETGAFGVGEKGADGEWKSRRLPYDGQITNLTAIDSHTIAWLQANFVCRVDLSQDLTGPNSPFAHSSYEDGKAPLTNGLVLWLDASTLQLADQAPVQELEDLSPRRNKAVFNQDPPKFNGPKSGSALNGKGTISFSSSNNVGHATGLVTTRSSGINGNKPRTIFAVVRREVGRSMIVGLGNPGVAGAYFGVADQFDGFVLPGTMQTDGRVPVMPRNWNVLSVVHDGNAQKGYVNGELKSTTSTQLATADAPLELGARTVSNGESWRAAASDGGFAEVLVYDRALTESDRRHVESYLQAKYFNRKILSPQGPLVWFDAGMNGFTGLTYSRETGDFLVTRTEKGRDSVWRVNPKNPANLAEVTQGQSIRDVQWAGPDRFLHSSHLDTRHSINLADMSGNGNKQLLQLWGSGSFEWFKLSPDHKQLFIFGNISNTPTAEILRCDLDSGQWHSVMSISDHPFGRTVLTEHQGMHLPGGDVTCTFYRPANFSKHKKYPLVIGDTMITDPIYGEPFMTGMAAGGAIVAVVERPWWTVGIEHWKENVWALYEQLKHDSTVDTRRVYLFAASAETRYLSELVQTNPAPWKGLILLNPSQLPDFSRAPLFQRRPRMLLDAGGEEHDDDHFKKFQKDSLSFGVVVEFHTHPGETHRMVGALPKLERARELKHFVFEE